MSRQLIKGMDNNKIEESIIANCGELTFVAEELGVTYKAVEKAVEKSPELQDAVRIGREALLDAAERCVMNALKNGDSSMAKFVLKNIGTARGWLPDNPQAAVQVNVIPPSEQAKRVRQIFGLPEEGSENKFQEDGKGNG